MIAEDPDGGVCLLFNAAMDPCVFQLGGSSEGGWLVAINTAKASPSDAPDESVLIGRAFTAAARSTVVLIKDE